jgi:putative hydroxymethylpyrimidine transport system substrate-binding protein
LPGLLLIVAVLFLATGCGDDDSDGSSATASDANGEPETTDVTIMGDYLPWASTGPMYAAAEEGYYEDEGLNVTIRAPAGSADAATAVAANKVQFGISDVPAIIQAYPQDVPIVSIGATFRNLAQGMIYEQDSGIEEPADLEGETVGVNVDPANEALADTTLASAGLTRDDVNYVDPGFGIIKLLRAGKVAAGQAYVDFEGAQYRVATGKEPGWLLAKDYGVPDYYNQVLIGNREWIEENPNTTRAFLRATAKGVLAFVDDPEKYTPILAKQNEFVPLEVQNAMAETAAPRMVDEVTDEDGVLWQDEEIWGQANEWLLDQGVIDESVDPNEYFTNDYVDTSVTSSSDQ